MPAQPLRGVFPVVPTTFTDTGGLDLASQLRCVDFMLDAGSNGLCILANFSEQFLLSDDERETLTCAILDHVKGRAPVIVTTTHFSSAVCAQRSRRAQERGAAMVMVMPPYHGATLRVSETLIREFYARVSDAIEGPWDGEEAITLLPDLEAGATGSMTGGGYPDGIRKIMDPWLAGDREAAADAYYQWLPLINYENRQGGIQSAKILMKEGGVIACDAMRHPFPQVHQAVREGLIATARRLDPVVLRWGKS